MFSKEDGAVAPHDEGAKNEAQDKGIRSIIPEIKALETPFMGSAGALVLLATILVLVGTGIIYLFQMSRENAIEGKKSDYATLSNKLSDKSEGGLGKFQSDLQEIINGRNALASTLTTRPLWSRFWETLRKNTPADVDYSSLSIDESGVLSLSGETKTYATLAKLMVNLQNAKDDKNNMIFSEVQVGGMSKSKTKDLRGTMRDVTTFSLSMKINLNLLY